MRIILHIGIHKTGSTAIQSWLKTSQAHLASHHIVALPSPPFSLSRSIMEAVKLDDALITACRSELATAIASQSISPDHTLVLSAEGFSGSIRKGYTNAPICAKILAQILAEHTVTVAVYLRPQDSFIESLYTQRIHQGESTSFPEYLAALPSNAFDWQNHVQAFAATFGQASLRVRPYHKSQLPESDSILRDFCQILGCPFAPTSTEPTIKNVGYSRDAMELARSVNPSLSAPDQHTLRKWLQKTASKGTWNAYSYFTPEQRSTILSRYASSNEQVAQTHLGGSWDSFFPTSPPAPAYQGLTPAAVSQILVKLLLEQQRHHHEQRQAAQQHHQTQINSLQSLLKQTKKQLTQLEKRLLPLSQAQPSLTLLGQSRLLRRLSKWEQSLRQLFRRPS